MANIKVDYINHMGDDLTVVNAARVSFDKESEATNWYDTEKGNHYFPLPVLDPKDIKLIKYLAKHNHWSPFSHCFIQFRNNGLRRGCAKIAFAYHYPAHP